MHAGAAIHCWPAPTVAVAEISRVLKPGGVFVASTFLVPTAPLGEVIGDDLVQPLSKVLGDNGFGFGAGRERSFRWWAEQELRDLCSQSGLVDFQRVRKQQFILFTARKPEEE